MDRSIMNIEGRVFGSDYVFKDLNGGKDEGTDSSELEQSTQSITSPNPKVHQWNLKDLSELLRSRNVHLF